MIEKWPEERGEKPEKFDILGIEFDYQGKKFDNTPKKFDMNQSEFDKFD